MHVEFIINNIMSKKISIWYSFIEFAIIYFPFKCIFETYSSFSKFQCLATAFIATLILAPKFQVVKTNDGEKLFMKWLFLKGVKEIK
jgi:hypothetical protein